MRTNSTSTIAVIQMGKLTGPTSNLYGQFGAWFAKAFQTFVPNPKITIADVESAGARMLTQADGIILSGAVEGVYDNLPWRRNFDRGIQIILEQKIPLLGVCFGHQYLIEILGGSVEHRPQSEEFGWFQLVLTEAAYSDPLFENIPHRFGAWETHQDMAVKTANESVVLAYSRRTPVQAFRYREHVWGVQFHPEMTRPIVASIINEALEEAKNKKDGIRADRLKKALSSLDNKNRGKQILQNFYNFCRRNKKTSQIY